MAIFIEANLFWFGNNFYRVMILVFKVNFPHEIYKLYVIEY